MPHSRSVIWVGLFVLALNDQPVTGQKTETICRHEGPVYAVAFSPSGKLLAGVGQRADKSGEVILWEASTGKQLARMLGHESPVMRVAFTENGKVLATSSKDHLIFWEVPSGKLLSKYPGVHFVGKHGVAVWDIAADNGQVKEGVIHRRDLEKKETVRTWRVPAGLAFWPTVSRDGEQLAVLVADQQWQVVVLNMGPWTERVSFPLPDTGTVHSLAISPDNRVLAVGSGGEACLWDMQSGKLRHVLARAAEGDGEADV